MAESIFRGFKQMKLLDEPSVINIDKSSLTGKYEDPDTSFRPDSYEVEPATNSIVRQHFHPEVEQWLCKQANLEFLSFYEYLGLWSYFDSCDVGLVGFAKFFLDSAMEEREHAVTIGKYINKRGGRVTLFDITKPTVRGWENGLEAMQYALQLEKNLTENLYKLRNVVSKHSDPDTEKLVDDFICKQVKVTKLIGRHVFTLKKMVGTKLGEYIYDQETLKGKLITDSLSCSSSSSSSSSSSGSSSSDSDSD